MEAVDRDLVLRRGGRPPLHPALRHVSPDPGYVGAYPPGVRENGGQYTHGAVWSVFAWAALGRADRAGELFALINPVNHAVTPLQAERYRVEPYVVAADIYSVDPYVGRGGWTWYTGSSGWMFRAGLEAVLGVHLPVTTCGWHPACPRGGTARRSGFAIAPRSTSSSCRTRTKAGADDRRGGRRGDWRAPTGCRWGTTAPPVT